MMQERNPLPPGERQYLIDQRDILETLHQFERVSVIETGFDNLGSCIAAVGEKFKQQARALSRGEIEAMQQFPIVISGVPGRGKSFITTRLFWYFEAVGQELEEEGIDIRLIRYNWDETEDQLRDLPKEERSYLEDIINSVDYSEEFKKRVRHVVLVADDPYNKKPIPGEPDTDEFLEAVGTLLEIKVARDMQEGKKCTVILIDKPGGAAVRLSDSWYTVREYNDQIINRIADVQDSFSDIPREKICLTAIGCTAGAIERELLVPYRDFITYAKTLEEANRINVIYGLPLFESEDEWRSLPKGGSEKVVRKAEGLSRNLGLAVVRFLGIEFSQTALDIINRVEKAYFSDIPDDMLIQAAQVTRIRGLGPGEILSILERAYCSFLEAILYEHNWRLKDLENYRVGLIEHNPPDYAAVVENDVSLPGIKVDELRELFENLESIS